MIRRYSKCRRHSPPRMGAWKAETQLGAYPLLTSEKQLKPALTISIWIYLHYCSWFQAIVTAFLGQVGRGEIDGDALGGQRQPGGDERGAHSFAALADRLVGQANDVEHDSAGGDEHLHVDGARLDALEGDS